MKKISFLLLIIIIFSSMSGCNSTSKKNDLAGIHIKTYTKVDDLGDTYGLYYGFTINNERKDDSYLSIEFTPNNSELKKLVGTRSVTQNTGNGVNTFFLSESGSTLSLGETISIPKKGHSIKELDKKIKDFSYTLSNGEIIKYYKK
ncbi:hypothetical protein AAGG74_14605 [Bacillus mexicanus]|uniref:hypothetical protein n=1 Tax=Bacillus mexicanus TaxID=2834415 RepID=UPI003D1EEE3F